MGVTIDELAYTTYRYAGLVGWEQTGLNPDQTAEFKQTYNSMVNAWRADGLTVSHVQRMLFPLIPNKGDYTVGPGGDFDIPWQDRVERAGIVLVCPQTGQDNGCYPPPCDNPPPCPTGPVFAAPISNPEYPIWPLTVDEYQMWILKQQTTSWPRRFWYERAGPPLGILHFLYIPTDANLVALYVEHFLMPISATGNTEIEFPPSYQEAIETNVARRIAMKTPGSQISQDTLVLARSSLALLKNANNRPLERRNDLDSSNLRSNVFAGNRYGPVYS